MKLYKISFPKSAFSGLDEQERVFFLRRAHIHNDLRHIEHLLHREANGLAANPSEEIDQLIILHQDDFAIRLWNGTLVEAWKVIAHSWFDLQPDTANPRGPKIPSGSGFSANFAPALDAAGQEIAQEALQFFTGPNVPYTIRNKFAFHYDGSEFERRCRRKNAPTASASNRTVFRN